MRFRRLFSARRSIIVHFHFFKNAGTSVERILQRQFGSRFLAYEHGAPSETFPASVTLPVLEQRPEIQAVSSHTVSFPLPTHPDWSFYPIVFIRHPLDRILSIYLYEKFKDLHKGGNVLAKIHGLPGYLSARLESPEERTLRNYQAWMLSGCPPGLDVDEEIDQTARDALSDLPVVGVVDEFTESIRQYQRWLAPHFRGLKMEPEHSNRSVLSGISLAERMQLVKDLIGEDLFQRIERENELDLALHRLARERLLEQRTP